MFHLKRVCLQNYKCFDLLEIDLERDVTVIFAENAGGKTALLTALALMLGQTLPQEYQPPSVKLSDSVRRVRDSAGRWQAGGVCEVTCWASLAGREDVAWRVLKSATSALHVVEIDGITEAIEEARQAERRWPLIAYYGTGRLMGRRDPILKPWAHRAASGIYRERPADRMGGYRDCLNPSVDDEQLLTWWVQESLGDVVRARRAEAERGLWRAVERTIKEAVPELEELWFDPATGEVNVSLAGGERVSWDELSDGFHIMLGLVGDIARRAVILNEQDGQDAPRLAEGIVLIDEIDLHLHPKWQRRVMPSLQRAFPNLQWVVTTHSPQVLSSVENRQARLLSDHALDAREVRVDGRDSNTILRDWMATTERDADGVSALADLHDAIDSERIEDATTRLKALQARWGDTDPALTYAEKLLNWARRDANAAHSTAPATAPKPKARPTQGTRRAKG